MTTLYAPPREADAFTRAMSPAPITAPLSPSILIADDDDEVRDVIEFRLQVAGYRTLTADNGQSALSLAIERRPRVIILDVTMPQIDGLTVCNRLHATPCTAEIPVLMISANCADQDRELGLAAGADDYLPKPFTSHEMMRRVNWLLLSAGR
ncbi:response regulator [Paractinoplanes hotanensis]|jgi:DNA-binding response OmpR family regulator|uniref:Response regulator n=1 Tax=Paractinoplanes hotanensis TaxID=2906497 RepID=A0ABT0Y4T9_9ACTN|nr:response regulator [Actinoplanes hotanensis]MCM4080840.1 response regulator [Actinoplanes hotanensis]